MSRGIRSNPLRQGWPSTQGRFIFDTWRGKPRVRAWPRKRGKPTSQIVLDQNEWFRNACRVLKLCEPSQQLIARRIVKGSGLYPRDLLMRCLSTGYADLDLGDGQILTMKPFRVERMSFRGAIIEKTATQAIAGSTYTPIIWNTPTVDPYSMWNVANPTRLTVPAWATTLDLTAGHLYVTGTSRGSRLVIRKNGTTWYASTLFPAGTTPSGTIATGPLSVVGGDYFEALTYCGAAGTLQAAPTNFIRGVILGTT